MSEAASLRSVGLVVALAAEAKALTRRAVRPGCITPLAGGVRLQLSGIGPLAAQRAAHELADAGASALAIFGVAGALDANLRSGTLFCPERILDENGQGFTTDPRWHADLQQLLSKLALPVRMTGSLLSVAQPLLTPAAKKIAYDHHGALAVDMESAAVAAAAQERKLPFLALRAIVDEAGDTIAPALHASIDAWGRPRALKLLVALGSKPSLLSTLPGLHSRMRQATRALRAAHAAAGSALGWHH